MAGLLLAQVPVHAQSGACDQLKATLAARIDPGIRGFSLEVVPASTPVPPGAKVIGTCEGGARKVLFRRQAAQRADAAPSAVAAEAKQEDKAPDRPALATTTTTPTTLRPAPPAAAQAPAPAPAAAPAPAPAPIAETPPVAAPVAVTPAVAVPAEASAPAPEPGSPEASVPAAAPSLMTAWFLRYWPWLAAALTAVLAVPLWGWLAHRRAYDSAGLPRGPRLN